MFACDAMGVKILLVHSLPNGAQQFRFDRKCEALARRLSPFAANDIISLNVAPANCAERLGELVPVGRPDDRG